MYDAKSSTMNNLYDDDDDDDIRVRPGLSHHIAVLLRDECCSWI